MEMNFDKEINEMQADVGALDESVALNKILLKLFNNSKKVVMRLIICLVISLILNLTLVIGIIIYESQFTVLETTTSELVTETSQEVEGDNAEINNVSGNQYKDNAIHNQGKGVE